MARKHIVTKEIESETKIAKHLYFRDFLFLAAGAAFTLLLKNQVHDSLQTVFMIFSFIAVVVLALPSGANPGRRNWQSVILWAMHKECVYHMQMAEEAKEGEEHEQKKDRKKHGRAYSHRRL